MIQGIFNIYTNYLMEDGCTLKAFTLMLKPNHIPVNLNPELKELLKDAEPDCTQDSDYGE